MKKKKKKELLFSPGPHDGVCLLTAAHLAPATRTTSVSQLLQAACGGVGWRGVGQTGLGPNLRTLSLLTRNMTSASTLILLNFSGPCFSLLYPLCTVVITAAR